MQQIILKQLQNNQKLIFKVLLKNEIFETEFKFKKNLHLKIKVDIT